MNNKILFSIALVIMTSLASAAIVGYDDFEDNDVSDWLGAAMGGTGRPGNNDTLHAWQDNGGASHKQFNIPIDTARNISFTVLGVDGPAAANNSNRGLATAYSSTGGQLCLTYMVKDDGIFWVESNSAKDLFISNTFSDPHNFTESWLNTTGNAWVRVYVDNNVSLTTELECQFNLIGDSTKMKMQTSTLNYNMTIDNICVGTFGDCNHSMFGGAAPPPPVASGINTNILDQPVNQSVQTSAISLRYNITSTVNGTRNATWYYNIYYNNWTKEIGPTQLEFDNTLVNNTFDNTTNTISIAGNKERHIEVWSKAVDSNNFEFWSNATAFEHVIEWDTFNPIISFINPSGNFTSNFSTSDTTSFQVRITNEHMQTGIVNVSDSLGAITLFYNATSAPGSSWCTTWGAGADTCYFNVSLPLSGNSTGLYKIHVTASDQGSNTIQSEQFWYITPVQTQMNISVNDMVTFGQIRRLEVAYLQSGTNSYTGDNRRLIDFDLFENTSMWDLVGTGNATIAGDVQARPSALQGVNALWFNRSDASAGNQFLLRNTSWMDSINISNYSASFNFRVDAESQADVIGSLGIFTASTGSRSLTMWNGTSAGKFRLACSELQDTQNCSYQNNTWEGDINQWYHIQLVNDGTTAVNNYRIFIDGEEIVRRIGAFNQVDPIFNIGTPTETDEWLFAIDNLTVYEGVFQTWSSGGSDIVGATCNATLVNDTTFTRVGNAITWVESLGDGVNNTVDVQCGAAGFEFQQQDFTYANDYWVTPNDYTFLTDFTDATMDGLEASGGVWKCSKITAETSNGLGDTLALYANHSGFCSSGFSEELRVFPSVGNEPSSTGIATCNITSINSGQWNSCEATLTDDMARNDEFFACSINPKCIVMDGVSNTGVFYTNLTGTWGISASEIGITLIQNNTFNTTLGGGIGTCVRGFAIEEGSSNAISGATITVEPSQGSTNSIASGEYVLCGLTSGIPLYMYASASGYDPWIIPTNTFEVASNTTKIINISMTPKAKAGRIFVTAIDSDGNEFETNNQFKESMSISSDTTIRNIEVIAYDSKDDPLTSGLNVTVTSNCSFSSVPTDWELDNKGGGRYDIRAEFGGIFEYILNAVCSDNNAIVMRIRGAGIDFTSSYFFEPKDLELRSLIAFTDNPSAYTWVQVNGTSWDIAGLNDKVDLTECTVEAMYSNLTSISSATSATIIGNQLSANISVSDSPSSIAADIHCNATGYREYIKKHVLVVSDDWLVYVCNLKDTVGDTIRFHPVGEFIEHRCEFNTTASTDLSTMLSYVEKDLGDNWDSRRQLIHKPTQSVAPNFTFSRSFAETSSPARYIRVVTLQSVPEGVQVPEQIWYYDKVTGSATPPKKIGMDVPSILDKGGSYNCVTNVDYTGPFSRTRFWLEINGIEYATDAEQTSNGAIQIFTITFANIGSNNDIPLGNDPASIFCNAELEFECETCDDYTGRVVFGPEVTAYTGTEEWDFLGFFGFTKAVLGDQENAREMVSGNVIKQPGNWISDVIESMFLSGPINLLLTLLVLAIMLVTAFVLFKVVTK